MEKTTARSDLQALTNRGNAVSGFKIFDVPKSLTAGMLRSVNIQGKGGQRRLIVLGWSKAPGPPVGGEVPRHFCACRFCVCLLRAKKTFPLPVRSEERTPAATGKGSKGNQKVESGLTETFALLREVKPREFFLWRHT